MCGEVVLRTVGGYANPAKFTDKFFNRFFAVLEGVKLGWNTVMTGLEGIRLQFINTLQIKVEQIIECPTNAEVAKIFADHGKYGYAQKDIRASETYCVDGWVFSLVSHYQKDCNTCSGFWTDSMYFVARFVSGSWKIEQQSGSGPLCFSAEERRDYAHWPKRIRNSVGC